MRVVVAFHDLQASEASDLGDAFWLADSSTNRGRAEEAWSAEITHPNSAIFDWDSGVVEDDDILERLDDINLHQPAWSEIRFFADNLTTTLQARLKGRGITAERQTGGFCIKR